MELATMVSSAAAPAVTSQLPPGFRFHPTDDELILHYLRNRAASLPCPVPIIADVDIYKFDPWDLPCKAVYGDGEWYFFSPRDRKYPNGIRPNRAARSGYWKATGTDKPIHDTATGESVGVKKALVFYKGRPPKGTKTDWIMHEYRLAGPADPLAAAFRPPVKFRNVSMRLDDWVLCRIYKKSGQASPMVPPLADYDHLDNDEHYSSGGGGLDDFCSSSSSFVYAPTTSSATATAATTTAGPPRLPKLPSFSDLFDDYALAQIFDNAAVPPDADQHTPFAMHPSLNQLLAVGDDSAHSSPSELMTTYSSYPAAGSAVGVAKKRKDLPDEFAHIDAGHPPVAKRLHASFFDAPPPAKTSSHQVLGGLTMMNHNNNMLPRF